MTYAERAAITEHLATKVLGWHDYRTYWCQSDGTYIIKVDVFKPLTDANDCSLVMAAWHQQQHELTISTQEDNPRWVAVAAQMATEAYEPNKVAECFSESLTEAVCLAIYRASEEGR